MSIKIEAYQIAEAINIKRLRSDFKATPHSGNISELFYCFETENRYLYLFDYGVVVFGNYDEVAKSEFFRFVKDFTENWLDGEIFEEYLVEINEKQQKAYVKSQSVILPNDSPSAIRIVMLNTGQSVALEYYETLTDQMLDSTKQYTKQLEQKGKLDVTKKALLQYIGKVLNVKNSVVDNLYILDDPNLVWDDTDLDTLNRNLKTNFDTNLRFRDLDYRLKIVENNLTLFTDLLQHRESSRLEWIIIILILIELLNVVFNGH